MRELSARTAQELLEEPITEADWVIEDILPVGAHILAGAPKIGKSWMMLAMGLAVSMGQPFWDYAVCQGAVLYLCLEDTYARVKKRLWKLTNEANDRFYLTNSAATIKDGLAEQIEYFVITHPDLKLVFIDTFQKVRSPTGDSVYAADYGDFSALKAVADKHSLAMVVHHTRKMADEDIMNTVSGSSGITGSADSIWVLKRASRGVGDATLTVTGRDVEFRELKLALRDCRWNLIKRTSDEELEERDIPDCVLKVVEFMRANDVGAWSGSVGKLIDATAVKGATVATFGKFLAQHSVFMRLRGIAYSKKHTGTGKWSHWKEPRMKGVKAMKALMRYSFQLSPPSWLSSHEALRSQEKPLLTSS